MEITKMTKKEYDKLSGGTIPRAFKEYAWNQVFPGKEFKDEHGRYIPTFMNFSDKIDHVYARTELVIIYAVSNHFKEFFTYGPENKIEIEIKKHNGCFELYKSENYNKKYVELVPYSEIYEYNQP